MDHRLVRGIENALAWDGPAAMGTAFAVGTLPDPDLCRRLLTPAGLLDILARRALAYPQLRCLQDGVDLHPRDYLTMAPTSRGHRDWMPDMPKLGRLLAHGATLVLDNLGPLDATLEVACRALAWWAGEPARVNAYLTTQAASGWGIHWDTHDVICVQLAGEKSWEVRGPSRIAPMDRDFEPNAEPSTDIVWSGTMHPGDVMHIPRGWWHQATRTNKGDGGHSLHATFGLTRRTGIDWLEWITDQARANELFRRDLDQRTSPNRRHDQHQQFAHAAAELLRTHSPTDYLSARRREHTSSSHNTTFGLFGPPETIVCITDFPPEIDIHGDNAIVTAAGRKITVPVDAVPVLQQLLSGRPASIADTTVHTGIDAAPLARALITAGLCTETTPGLAGGYDGMITPIAATT